MSGRRRVQMPGQIEGGSLREYASRMAASITELTRESRATVHVFRNGGLSIRQLRAEYPNFNPKRGDIIIDASKAGDRSEGIRFFDGTEIIGQYDGFDDYGGPPIEFRVGTEFPVGYWDLKGRGEPDVIVYDAIDPLVMPYWHSDSPPWMLS
jgi:hypothetical protein